MQRLIQLICIGDKYLLQFADRDFLEGAKTLKGAFGHERIDQMEYDLDK